MEGVGRRGAVEVGAVPDVGAVCEGFSEDGEGYLVGDGVEGPGHSCAEYQYSISMYRKYKSQSDVLISPSPFPVIGFPARVAIL